MQIKYISDVETVACLTAGSQYESFYKSMISKTAAVEKLLKIRATLIIDLRVPEGARAAAEIVFRDRAASDTRTEHKRRTVRASRGRTPTD